MFTRRSTAPRPSARPRSPAGCPAQKQRRRPDAALPVSILTAHRAWKPPVPGLHAERQIQGPVGGSVHPASDLALAQVMTLGL